MNADLNVVNIGTIARVLDHGCARRGADQDELDLLHNGAIAVRNGRIAAVGLESELQPWLEQDVPTIDAGGGTVLPGLVECHSHPLFVGYRHDEFVRKIRGEHPDAIKAAGGGIWASVLRCREASDDELLENAVRAYEMIVKGGVTTLEVKSGYGLTVEQELRMLSILQKSSERTPLDLVCTFLGAHIVPREAVSAAAYADLVQNQMFPKVREQGIAEFQDIVCELDVFPETIARKLLLDSAQHGLPTRVHADASDASRGWTSAVECGAVAADHLTYTPDDEIRAVGRTDTVAVLLPIAEQVYLDERRANARLFMETGVPVAIATDYCSSIHATSLLTAVQCACTWYRITPAEALVGATLNAAYVLHRQADRGSLDIGKRGDLLILDCPHPDELGVSLGAPLVRDVIRTGEVIYSA